MFQCDLRSWHSTASALLEVQDDIALSVDAGNRPQPPAAFDRVANADLVPHQKHNVVICGAAF